MQALQTGRTGGSRSPAEADQTSPKGRGTHTDAGNNISQSSVTFRGFSSACTPATQPREKPRTELDGGKSSVAYASHGAKGPGKVRMINRRSTDLIDEDRRSGQLPYMTSALL
ncbi:hypothetical protein Bbelb_306510 [Branchiostoma belcheri]|nr:hypothetical protein Bbelb_306510 [Branchiostoma belcheri]